MHLCRSMPLAAGLLFVLGACAVQTGVDVDEVPALGSLEGHFACPVDVPDATEYDLGPAHFEGDIDKERYEEGLLTQGCFARVLEAKRGRVVSAVFLQHKDFNRVQVLELNIPLTKPDGSDLDDGDDVVFAGPWGGFGSMYSLREPGADPLIFLRTAGGTVYIEEVAGRRGKTLRGSFQDLRMGDIQ